MYQTVRITHLCKLIPFGDFGYIEKVAVDAIKFGYLPAKIDHKMGTVRFGIQVRFLPCGRSLEASCCLPMGAGCDLLTLIRLDS